MFHPEFNVDDVYRTIDFHLSQHSERLRSTKEDLRQDIMLTVMERSCEYDSSLASWPTFLSRIVTSSIESFFLNRRWRKNQPLESLDEIAEREPQRLLQVSDADSSNFSVQEKEVLVGEVRKVIDAIPEQLRECAEYLMDYSPMETADMMNLPPNVLQRNIKKIKRIFEKANIRPDHFEKI